MCVTYALIKWWVIDVPDIDLVSVKSFLKSDLHGDRKKGMKNTSGKHSYLSDPSYQRRS
ncbi:hypothetical protein P7M41_26320 [Vibrio parahaemolyticus]|nr:hypothetical protein [Vibrio parahaemolyticus]